MRRGQLRPCSGRRGYGDRGCRIHVRARQVSFCLYGLVEGIAHEVEGTLEDALWT